MLIGEGKHKIVTEHPWDTEVDELVDHVTTRFRPQ